MATKLGKSAFPAGHNPDDFQCFGPPATKDGEFENVKICDMGCFTQDGKDSNKMYHAAVVKSKKDGKFYAYFEWGRTGAKNPQFQFVQCSSEQEAQLEFSKQLHDKNDKRGQWIQHSTLGRILQAKPGKDCYLVRPQATRSTGLPDARTIKFNEGAKVEAKPEKKTTKKSTIKIDSATLKLMRDLNVATVSYTRGSMADDTLPTQGAIDEARDILTAATKRVGQVGDNVNAQVNDQELKQYTSMLYGRIPKKKDRNAAAETWILSKNNIFNWQQDLDAFEGALYATNAVETETKNDPFDGMPISMDWIDPNSAIGKYIYNWAPKSTRNKHHGIGNLKIMNLWKLTRQGEIETFHKHTAKIHQSLGGKKISERPLHQHNERVDLSSDNLKIYNEANVGLLWHGTRSVNLTGIMRTGFRFPKELTGTGVAITGAMYGGGVYYADDHKKSIGYTSHTGSYWSSGAGGIKSRGAFMLLCDVCCGNPHVAPGPHPYVKPPIGTHCIFGKSGYSQVQNNEWIIFDKSQTAIRYLIEFTTS